MPSQEEFSFADIFTFADSTFFDIRWGFERRNDFQNVRVLNSAKVTGTRRRQGYMGRDADFRRRGIGRL